MVLVSDGSLTRSVNENRLLDDSRLCALVKLPTFPPVPYFGLRTIIWHSPFPSIPFKKKKKARRCGIPMRSKIFYSFARCLKPSTLTPCLYRHPMNNLFLLPPATFGLSFYFCSVHRHLRVIYHEGGVFASQSTSPSPS